MKLCYLRFDDVIGEDNGMDLKVKQCGQGKERICFGVTKFYIESGTPNLELAMSERGEVFIERNLLSDLSEGIWLISRHTQDAVWEKEIEQNAG